MQPNKSLLTTRNKREKEFIANNNQKPKKHKKALILKSGFKNALKNISQLLGLGFLITMTAVIGLFSVLTVVRVQNAYANLVTTSNQHDFVIDMNKTTRISFNPEQWIGGENVDEHTNQELFEQYLVNAISRKGITNDNGQIHGDSLFTWSRTEGRNFKNIYNNHKEVNIKAITKSGFINENDPSNLLGDVLVDRLVLSDPQTDSYFSTDKTKATYEVILQPNFAKANNIKRGDIIRMTPDVYGSELLVKNDVADLTFGANISINDETLGINNSIYKDQVWFQVIGFGTSADFVYPVINSNAQIPSAKKDMIVYVDPETFGLHLETIKNEANEQMKLYSYDMASSKLSVTSENDREVFFSGKFKNLSSNSPTYLSAFNKEWVRYGNLNTQNIKLFFAKADTDYKFYYRIAAYGQIIWAYWLFAILLIVLLLMIAVFVIVLIIKKQINEAKAKLGTFKALGYSNLKLLTYFLATPIIIGVFGFLIAYTVVLSLQNIYVNVFATYFSILFNPFNSIWWQAGLIFLVILFVLNFITLLIAYLVIEQSALTLLQGSLAKKNTRLGMGVKKLFRRANPNVKLHVALVLGSSGKILGTSATLLIATMLVSAVTIVPTVLEKNQQAVFAGLNYDDVVEYNEPVANNPATFLKTYNSKNQQAWTYNQEHYVTDVSEASNQNQEYMTAYPLKYNQKTGAYVYDTKKIIEDLLTNNISSNFYSYNVPVIKDNNYASYYEIAKNNYTNWKVMSTEYLQKLDALEIPERDVEGVPYNAIATITNQWLNYKYLMNEVEKNAIEVNSNSGEDQTLVKVKKLAGELQNFYKKYVNGLPVRVNPKYLNSTQTGLDLANISNIDFDRQLSEISTKQIYVDLNVKTPLKLGSAGNNNLYYGFNTTNQSNWQSSANQFVNQNFDFSTKTVSLDKVNAANIDLKTIDWSLEQFKNFNTNLILWYWINFEAKLGTMLMQATYQGANNSVQQNLKQALLENKNYNLSSNVVPYDQSTETLGTMVNGTYHANNQELNLKIYGLDQDNATVHLKDRLGQDIKPNLFKKLNENYQEYTPIVINQTVAQKLNLNVKDIMDIAVLKKVLVDKDNQEISLDQVKMGVAGSYDYATQTTNNFISEAKKNYFAYNSQNNGWNSESQIQTASINGYSLASKTVEGIAKSTEIQTAANNSLLKKTYLGTNKQFVIVGISENYGESKAWIANEQANRLIGYDQVKKYFFNNFFVNEWRNSPALKDAYLPDEMYEITETQWKNFVDYLNFMMLNWSSAQGDEQFNSDADNPYYDFKKTFLELSDNFEDQTGYKYAARYVWQIFENAYPIFNYKYTANKNYDDDVYTASRTQAFGDFSPTGMVGSSTIASDDTGVSVVNYTQGYSENSLQQVNSLKDKRELLQQVGGIIRIIIYFMTIVVLVVATIITVISTILIIQENAQFIATMKILGYTNAYVMTQVLGIYFFPFILMYVGGVLLGWFGIKAVVTYISTNYTFVIPYLFSIWIPFAIFGIMGAIYLITILISFKQFVKIRPIDSLQTSS